VNGNSTVDRVIDDDDPSCHEMHVEKAGIDAEKPFGFWSHPFLHEEKLMCWSDTRGWYDEHCWHGSDSGLVMW